MRTIRTHIGLPHLLATTLLLVVATILLGVATRAAGAGLACDANWPLCDGGLLNLFPAGFPSFFEWIHRVVAMIAGVFIIGSTLAAWWANVDRTIAWAVTIGLILTPIQVTLGRETVLSYDLTVLNLHFWTAIVIFVLFAVATILSWSDRIGRSGLQLSLAGAAALIPVQIVFSPLVIDSYTTVMHTLQDAITLSLLFFCLVAGIVGISMYAGRRALTLSLTPALALVVIFFGRESVMGYDPLIDLVYFVVSGFVFASLVVLTWDVRRAQTT
ncbi:COX15/CtaA family protein [Halovivax gelatinilyticus]|uniref:COX15/CtaA family protein n=1 Tax=Halovivax gelatinilyticus TaxID=2961597 RepID=UPI0020CA77E5|nr:COX15/CtaA family protein [Halovivax gelatinilyticus]